MFRVIKFKYRIVQKKNETRVLSINSIITICGRNNVNAKKLIAYEKFVYNQETEMI